MISNVEAQQLDQLVSNVDRPFRFVLRRPDLCGLPAALLYLAAHPEFPTQEALSRYLTDRLARERASAGTAK